MPTVSRARLRQQVGLLKLRDTFVGQTVFSPNLGAGSALIVMHPRLANTALSGQQLGQNFYIRVHGVDYHVASFNVGSGAYVSAQTAATVVGSGATFEVHEKLPGDEKDRAIDGLVQHLWTRQEIPLAANGLLEYSLGNGFKVFGAYFFEYPTAATDRGLRHLPLGWNIVTTATGRELRLAPGTLVGSGQQIVIDAQVRATLGASDTATVNVPDEDWVLNGIAARCYQALIADAPGKEAGKYRDLANAYARAFVKDIPRVRDQATYGWRGAFDEYVG